MATVRKTSTMRTFETWTEGDILKSFNLVKKDDLPILQKWLENAVYEPTALELLMLNQLRFLLKNNTNIWNEDELKMSFIGPFLVAVNYFEKEYRNFSQRKLTATVNNIFIGGVVDYVVACGYQKPAHPFFCLHEYKRPRRTVSPFGGTEGGQTLLVNCFQK